MLAPVAAGVVLPRGFFGFAVSAMGGGPAPGANGGQVAVRPGVRGAAHADPHAQAQAQRPGAALRQRRVARLVHEPERSARAAQAALRLRRRGLGLPAGALLRPLLPVQGSGERGFPRGGKGPGDQTQEAVQLRLAGGDVDQLLWQL